MENSWIYRFCGSSGNVLKQRNKRRGEQRTGGNLGLSPLCITAVDIFWRSLSVWKNISLFCVGILINDWKEWRHVYLHLLDFTPFCLYSILSPLICLTFTLFLLLIIVIIIPLSHLHFTAFFPPKSFFVKSAFSYALYLFHQHYIDITSDTQETEKQVIHELNWNRSQSYCFNTCSKSHEEKWIATRC